MIYQEILGARRAHLEQPKEALSWQTRALSSLPGFHVHFHQCAYGAFCKDVDHQWRPVLKPTALRTTKKAMAQAMNRTCDKSHDHCRLEGHTPGGRLRTKYLEDYQPAMASIIAVNLAAEETPQTWDHGFAGDEASRSHQGRLVQLLTNNQQEAVRVVQKLHRNLGHPTPEKLCDLLQARGAADTILEVAKTYIQVCQLRTHAEACSCCTSIGQSHLHLQRTGTVRRDVVGIWTEQVSILVDLGLSHQVPGRFTHPGRAYRLFD